MKTLFDPAFEDQIHNTIEILVLLVQMLEKNESNNYSIADAAADWIFLKLKITDNQYSTFIMEELKEIFNDIVMMSYYLHPVYQGKNLTDVCESFEDRIYSYYIDEFDDATLQAAYDFTSKKGLFGKIFDKSI